MVIRLHPLFFVYLLIVLVLFQIQLLPLVVSAFNISFVISSSIESNFAESDSDSDPHPSRFLQDVLKVIAERKKWDSESIRVSKLENARYAHSQRSEFRFPIGEKDLIFRYSEKLSSWRSFEEQVEVTNFSQLVDGVSSMADLGPIELEGPVELLLLGEDRASLQLQQNTTLSGLKRILVREGITVQITGAREISLIRGSCSGSCNGNSGSYKRRVELIPFEDLFCIPLLPVHISGQSSFTAYKTANSNSSIEANLLSEETVELQPEKRFAKYTCRELHCPITSLSKKIASIEKLLRKLSGERIHTSGKQFSTSVKANVTASTMVTFRVELEKDVRDDDTQRAKLAEWRTKSSVDRVWFHVMARLDGDKLHSLEIKNVRPFEGADTVSWSSILSNVSLTEFSSFLIPPQALTLDVKW